MIPSGIKIDVLAQMDKFMMMIGIDASMDTCLWAADSVARERLVDSVLVAEETENLDLLVQSRN